MSQGERWTREELERGGWITTEKAALVQMPCCGFTYWAEHEEDDQPGTFTCPLCSPENGSGRSLALSEEEVAEIPALLEAAENYNARVPQEQGGLGLHTLIDKLREVGEARPD